MVQSRRAFIIAACALAAARPALAEPHAAPDRQQRLTSADSYLPMPTITAGVLQRNASNGAIVLDMGLDIPDAALRRRATANQPRLRDALRSALSTYASAYYRDRTAPDPVQLTRLLQLAVDRTLGASGARVLLTNVIYQRGGR